MKNSDIFNKFKITAMSIMILILLLSAVITYLFDGWRFINKWELSNVMLCINNNTEMKAIGPKIILEEIEGGEIFICGNLESKIPIFLSFDIYNTKTNFPVYQSNYDPIHPGDFYINITKSILYSVGDFDIKIIHGRNTILTYSFEVIP